MAVTLTRTTQTYDELTDSSTTATTTIVGTAIRVRGDANRYRALGLVESEAPTLLFVPDTYGDTPQVGDTLVWASATYTVRDVLPLAPDGVTIQARLIVER